MSDFDKIIVFGQYLSHRCVQTQMELNAMAMNDKIPIDSIRRKAGHLEAFQSCLLHLKELHQGDIAKFKSEYLEQGKTNEPDESDGA